MQQKHSMIGYYKHDIIIYHYIYYSIYIYSFPFYLGGFLAQPHLHTIDSTKSKRWFGLNPGCMAWKPLLQPCQPLQSSRADFRNRGPQRLCLDIAWNLSILFPPPKKNISYLKESWNQKKIQCTLTLINRNCMVYDDTCAGKWFPEAFADDRIRDVHGCRERRLYTNMVVGQWRLPSSYWLTKTMVPKSLPFQHVNQQKGKMKGNEGPKGQPTRGVATPFPQHSTRLPNSQHTIFLTNLLPEA